MGAISSPRQSGCRPVIWAMLSKICEARIKMIPMRHEEVGKYSGCPRKVFAPILDELAGLLYALIFSVVLTYTLLGRHYQKRYWSDLGSTYYLARG